MLQRDDTIKFKGGSCKLFLPCKCYYGNQCFNLQQLQEGLHKLATLIKSCNKLPLIVGCEKHSWYGSKGACRLHHFVPHKTVDV